MNRLKHELTNMILKKETSMLELYLFGVGIVLGAAINEGFFLDVYSMLNSLVVEEVVIGIAGILLVLVAALAWPIILAIFIGVGIAQSLKN